MDTPERARIGLVPGESPGGGEGRDRPIARRFRWPRRAGAGIAILAALTALVLAIVQASAPGAFRVDRGAVSLATVERRPFEETIAATGRVVPRNTVYLDVREGGRVEEVLVREGALLAAGEPLVRLSNSDLELRAIQADAQRMERLTALRESRFRLEQAAVDQQRELVELDYEIRRLGRQLERTEELYREELVSRQELEQVQDELEYYRQRKALSLEAARQDAVRIEDQIRQLEAGVAAMEASYEVIRRSLESLLVRAPAAGQLTALGVEVGQLVPAGGRLGQVDLLERGFVVRIALDEFFSGRIAPGLTASAGLGAERRMDLEVSRVYPEVREGRFEADLEFQGETAPEGLRPGQTLAVYLGVGGSGGGETLVVPRGPFFASTGGRWIYVVVADGEARRRPIRLGRQSPAALEVVDGLSAGERVIVSSYESFGDAERLILE